MPPRKSQKLSILSAILPFRALLMRVFMLVLVCTLIGVIFWARTQQEHISRARAEVMDTAMIAVNILSFPLRAIESIGGGITGIFSVYEENQLLRRQNQRLAYLEMASAQFAVENAKLRHLLNFVPEPELRFITARIVLDISNPLGQSAIVNAGAEEGVEKGQIVINEKGLVGRILEVGDHTARVLLITDVNSRVPVLTSDSGERGILMGNNRNQPLMRHIPILSKMEVGETITTSGDGEYYPSGLPVGTIKEIKPKEAVIETFISAGRLEYVHVVTFDAMRRQKASDANKSLPEETGATRKTKP